MSHSCHIFCDNWPLLGLFTNVAFSLGVALGRMVTYGDVGKQTSLSNQRNTYIHIAFTMGFAILRLLYPYMHKPCVHMVFWFENTTFQHFFTCGDSMGWFFHAMELLWFLKIRNSFCLRLCCVYIGRNFWGDFWGWMGCGVPCGRASPVQCWGDYRGPR